MYSISEESTLPDKELQEMLGVCVYMGGGPALMYAANALAAYEEFGGEKAPVQV